MKFSLSLVLLFTCALLNACGGTHYTKEDVGKYDIRENSVHRIKLVLESEKPIAVKVQGADAKTFKVLSKSHAVDKNKAYFNIKGFVPCDMKSYKYVGGPWSSDSLCIYYQDKKISFKNSGNLDVLSYYYAKASNFVFYKDRVILDADYESFKAINEREFTSNEILHSENNRLEITNFDPFINKDTVGFNNYSTIKDLKIRQRSPRELLDANYENATDINDYQFTARDKNFCYKADKIYNCETSKRILSRTDVQGRRHIYEIGSAPPCDIQKHKKLKTPLKFKHNPRYPRAAYKNKIEGFVYFILNIDKNGKPFNITVMDTDKSRLFINSAINAIKEAKADFAGNPPKEELCIEQTIEYRLEIR